MSLDVGLIPREELVAGQNNVQQDVDKKSERNSLEMDVHTAGQTESSLSEDLDFSARPSMEVASNVVYQSTDSTRESLDGKIEPQSIVERVSGQEAGLHSDSGRDSTEAQLINDMEALELQRQEEIHGYIERIDALQAKLQYLSRESAESAKKAASVAPSGSIEKKLAEKDEQIALLLDEGQKLSRTELKHMTVIKGLRSKTVENDREVSEAKKRVERLEKEKTALAERLKRAEVAERQSNQRQTMFLQAQKEAETLRSERNARKRDNRGAESSIS